MNKSQIGERVLRIEVFIFLMFVSYFLLITIIHWSLGEIIKIYRTIILCNRVKNRARPHSTLVSNLCGIFSNMLHLDCGVIVSLASAFWQYGDRNCIQKLSVYKGGCLSKLKIKGKSVFGISALLLLLQAYRNIHFERKLLRRVYCSLHILQVIGTCVGITSCLSRW